MYKIIFSIKKHYSGVEESGTEKLILNIKSIPTFICLKTKLKKTKKTFQSSEGDSATSSIKRYG